MSKRWLRSSVSNTPGRFIPKAMQRAIPVAIASAVLIASLASFSSEGGLRNPLWTVRALVPIGESRLSTGLAPLATARALRGVVRGRIARCMTCHLPLLGQPGRGEGQVSRLRRPSRLADDQSAVPSPVYRSNRIVRVPPYRSDRSVLHTPRPSGPANPDGSSARGSPHREGRACAQNPEWPRGSGPARAACSRNAASSPRPSPDLPQPTRFLPAPSGTSAAGSLRSATPAASTPPRSSAPRRAGRAALPVPHRAACRRASMRRGSSFGKSSQNRAKW